MNNPSLESLSASAPQFLSAYDPRFIAVIAALIALNIATFLVYRADKHRARRHQWRIAEHTLLTLAILGGSIGAAFAMLWLHHKTRHPKFRFGVPLCLALHAALGYLAFLYLSGQL